MFFRRGGTFSGILVASIFLFLQGPANPQVLVSVNDPIGASPSSAVPAARDSDVIAGTPAGDKNSTEFPIANNPDTASHFDSEQALSAAFDGTNYLVGFQEAFRPKSDCSGEVYAGNSRNIDAQLVSPTGELIGPRIKTGANGGTPLVAFDGTNYLMVWEEDAQYSTSIFGQFISVSGTLVRSQFTVGAGTDMNFSVNSILFDGANYFVVWQDRSTAGDDETGVIYGQFVAPSGDLLGSPITVSNAPNGQTEPTLAFDGTNILAAWVDGRNQSACYSDSQGEHCFESDIYAQFVTKSSATSAGTLYRGNFAVSNSSLPCDNPITAAFDGTNYFVAFTRETTLPNACSSSGCKWNAYGQLVTPSGVPTGSLITISDTAPNHFFADVVWLGTQYMVAWTENLEQASATVNGRYFSPSGAPLGAEFTLFSKNSSGAIPLAAPLLAPGGSKCFAMVDRGSPGGSFDCSANMDVHGAFINSTQNQLKFSLPSSLGSVAECGQFNYAVTQPSGGVPPYSYSLTGKPPAGIDISDEGDISGQTSSSPAKYSFSVCITDASQTTVSKPASITVTSPVQPGKPSGPSPANGAKNVTSTASLNWNATSNTDSYDLYFGTSSPPPLAASGLSNTGYAPSSLNSGTVYYWQVVSKRSLCSGADPVATKGPLWSFTTSKPAFSLPGSLGTVQECAQFNYAVTQPSGGVPPYSYSLTGKPPAGIDISDEGDISGQTSSSPDKYSFSVCITDASSTTVCKPASITVTSPIQPGKASVPSPANGKTGVLLDFTSGENALSWSTSDADSCDVYFGTSSPPTTLAGTVFPNSTEPYWQFYPGELNPSETYYWQIVARHDTCDGLSTVAKGPVWSFKTTTAASSVKGTAAAGSPIQSAQVSLVDSTGATANATTGADGSFSINSSGLKPPFLLQVTTTGGTTYYSVSADSNSTTTINITSLTDIIVRTWYSVQGSSVETAFSDPAKYPPPSAVAVATIASVVQSIVQPWLNQAGVAAAAFNPVSTPFTANGSGVDQVLDETSVTIDAGSGQITVTISNNSTTTQNSTVTPSTTGSVTCSTTATTGSGTTNPVTTSTQVPTTTAQQAALNGITTTMSNFMNTFNTKGASLKASDIAPYVDPNYLDGGETATQWETKMVSMAGVSMSYSGIQVNSLDTVNNVADVSFTVYMTKNGTTSTDALDTNFTQVGSSWLISGDGSIAKAYANTWAWANTGYTNSLRFEVDDPQGVVTAATVTGAGITVPMTVPIVCGGDTGISCGNAYNDYSKNAFQINLANQWPPTIPSTYTFTLTTSEGTKTYSWTVTAAFGFDSAGNPVPADYPYMTFTGGNPSLSQVMSGITLHGSVYIPIWVNGEPNAPHFNYEGPAGQSNSVSNQDIYGTWDSGVGIPGQANNFTIVIPPAVLNGTDDCNDGGVCYNITFQGQTGDIQGGWFGEDSCYNGGGNEPTSCTNSGIEIQIPQQ